MHVDTHTYRQEHSAHTTDVAACLPFGTLCKFCMRAKPVCGMSLRLVCVPEQGGRVNALNLK